MTFRYDDRKIRINDLSLYENVLKKRGLKQIRQFTTPSLKHPTAEEVTNLTIVGHTWSIGDRYFKLAHKYYKDSKLWWVIAWYNQKPTESHLQIGDVVDIPLPLEKILRYLEV